MALMLPLILLLRIRQVRHYPCSVLPLQSRQQKNPGQSAKNAKVPLQCMKNTVTLKHFVTQSVPELKLIFVIKAVWSWQSTGRWGSSGGGWQTRLFIWKNWMRKTELASKAFKCKKKSYKKKSRMHIIPITEAPAAVILASDSFVG